MEKVRFLQTLIFSAAERPTQKIELGDLPILRSSSVGPRSGSETASSSNIRSNHELADFWLSPDFDFFNTIGPKQTITVPKVSNKAGFCDRISSRFKRGRYGRGALASIGVLQLVGSVNDMMSAEMMRP